MLSHSCAKVGILVAILAGPTAQSVYAQVVSIRRGTFVFEAGAGNLDIRGNRGFSLVARVSLEGGRFEPYSQCQAGCEPGATVELDAFWGGNDLQGTATYRRVTYPDVGALDGDSSAEIGFSGSVTLPPFSDSAVNVTVPFDFAGSFAYGLTGPEAKRVLLSGGGRVTLTLRPHPSVPGTWIIERAMFQFTRVETR